MGGIVMGLLIQTNATDMGKLQLTQTAMMAAKTIWKGTGIKLQKIPMRNAFETEWRLICQRLGSCRTSPRKCNALISLIFSGVGMYFLNKRFGIKQISSSTS
jgi:hypothetical protein